MIEIGIIKDTPLNKIIDIRDKNQVIKAKYAIGKDDILKCSLMSEHFIEISFELNRNASFRRSDYIEWEGEKYTLRDDYRPEQINKRKYKYTLKFEALEMFFQDMQYWYLGRGLKESEWRLTGNPQSFLINAVENANRYFKTTEFKIGTVEPTITKDISFESNTSTFDALTRIAEEFEAEWYLMGKTLHLVNKASFGDEVDFETEVSVLYMKREEGESKTAYTRILALGSTRNIPYNYRNTGDDEAVDGVYQKRLRIPAIKGDVIDAYPDMSPDEVIEGTVIFDEIYPRREGAIEAIGTIEYTDKNANTGKTTKWYAYKFKDSGLNFKKEYLLPGQELKLQFTSGNLNGMDFALAFNEKGFSKTDNSQYFEIIRNEDYGKPLPNDILKPNAGDKYVLYGFNIALVSDQYVPAGESELYDKAVEWQKKQLRDTGVYECSTVIKHFMDRQMDLAIGQKVRLIFDDENATNRSSRIMGFEKKLNNKFDAIYTVGDNSTYSRLGKIEQQIKELQVGGVVYENTGGGSGVYVIKQFDTTRPTDFNVYSAKASDAMYLNKQIGGTVEADTTFAKNMQVQGAAISDVLQNSTFTAGQFGSGFQIKRDSNGQSYMEVDNILVRRETVFNRLSIAEIKSIGGTLLISIANIVLSNVESKSFTWKCYFDSADGTIPNDFVVGDQAICRKFTGKNIKYYWALVTAVGSDYIELSKTDKDGSGVPSIGDEVVQFGNRTDVNRQHAIIQSARGYDAPSTKQYTGVNSYDLTGKEVSVTSPKGNQYAGTFIIRTNGTTAPVYKDRSIFINGTTYYLNDRVSHLGSYWVCIVENTITTPSETSVAWRKDTAGQIDIDKAANQVRTDYKAEVKVLDDKIASKVSQSVVDALGNRVSQTESRIDQQAGRITSVVEKVNEIRIDGKNLVDNSQGIQEIGGNGTDSHEEIKYTNLTVDLVKDEEYTFQCKTDGVWGTVNATNTVEAFLMKDKSILPDNYVSLITNPCTFIAPKTGRYWIRIDSNKGSVKHSFWEFQIEKGNKATNWGLSQNDINKYINNIENAANDAKNTANQKNRTYYQDDKPEIPSEGHKIGDLWYMESLVDSSGNVNPDKDKNIYQLQYRWDGTTWVRINWSISQSKFTQTEKEVQRIVYRTGVNQLGESETLYSKFDQTADQIRLEVSGIRVGGRNLLLNSSNYNELWKQKKSGEVVTNNYYNGSRIVELHDAWGGIGYIGKNIKAKQYIYSFYAKIDREDANHEGYLICYGTTTRPVVTVINNLTTEWKQYSVIITPNLADENGIRIEPTVRINNNVVRICGFKLEEGNKATDYSPAIEDTQAAIDSKTTLDEVASSLTIAENKISLASKTIELNGTTIAKAIEAEDLVVQSDKGLSTLEVKKDGTFYAKGSKSADKSMIIDSEKQSITITSPRYASSAESIGRETSKIIISSDCRGIKVTGANDIKSNSLTTISDTGIYANTAGLNIFSFLGEIRAMASIVGLGEGSLDKENTGDFVAGVYGTSSNKGSAPDFGGYFDKLRANGLYLKVRRVYETTTLDREDCYVSCYNDSKIIVYLPRSPYEGQVIYIRRMTFKAVAIDGNGKELLRSDKNKSDIYTLWMAVYDGKYWNLNMMS